MVSNGEPLACNYDDAAVMAMLVALRSCPRDQQMDSLVAVVKVFVEVMNRG
jgi:hypothetical protein